MVVQHLTDFVYSSGYSNNDNLGLSSIVFADGKRFMIEETGVGATSGNIAGKKIVPIPETELSGSGAENDPYLINDPDDWYLLFAKIAQGTSYSGQFVQLNSDISVSNMVGISETNSFQGTFLGGGHTITAAMTDNALPTAKARARTSLRAAPSRLRSTSIPTMPAASSVMVRARRPPSAVASSPAP